MKISRIDLAATLLLSPMNLIHLEARDGNRGANKRFQGAQRSPSLSRAGSSSKSKAGRDNFSRKILDRYRIAAIVTQKLEHALKSKNL